MDIHKAAGILIKNKKLLVERSKGKAFFISPGGSIEPGETPKQALVRELREEFGLQTEEENFEEFGVFSAPAAGQEGMTVIMETFMVKKWTGIPTPNSEVEEIMWITSDIPKSIKVGSIFEHEVIPRLKKLGEIN